MLSRSKGGSVELTPHGHYLLTRARQILALNDEVLTTFRTPQIAGTVRLGTPDDYAFAYLPPILKRFAETHPAVQVDVVCSPSTELMHRIKADELDLTLISNGHHPRGLADGAAVARAAGLGDLHAVRAASAGSAAAGARRPRAVPGARAGLRMGGCGGACAGAGGPALSHRLHIGLAYRHACARCWRGWQSPSRPCPGCRMGCGRCGRRRACPSLPEFGILLLKGKRPLQPVTDALAAHIEESFAMDAGRAVAAE